LLQNGAHTPSTSVHNTLPVKLGRDAENNLTLVGQRIREHIGQETGQRYNPESIYDYATLGNDESHSTP